MVLQRKEKQILNFLQSNTALCSATRVAHTLCPRSSVKKATSIDTTFYKKARLLFKPLGQVADPPSRSESDIREYRNGQTADAGRRCPRPSAAAPHGAAQGAVAAPRHGPPGVTGRTARSPRAPRLPSGRPRRGGGIPAGRGSRG